MFFFRKKKAARAGFVPVILPDPAQPEDVQSDDAQPENENAHRKKVLVVDDDAVVAKALSLTLNARGYEVLCATDSAQAIQMVRDQDPDVMLVDVGLPPDIAMGGANFADGFQVTRWLQLANSRKIPSIIISGSNKPAYQRQAMAAGAEAFLAKPLNNDVLVESIESALAGPVRIAGGFETFKMAEGSVVD